MKKTIPVVALLIFSLSCFSQPAIQWQKSLGGTSYDEAHSVQQTADGGYIVAGFTQSNNGDVTGNHGGYDYWVVKLNSNGNVQWQKCLGGTGDDHSSSVQQTTDGGYIVAGRTGSNDGDATGNHGDWDYWVVKLDSSGNIQWQKCLGGTGSDFASSIQQTADGGFIVTGQTDSNDGDVTGNHGYSDYWVVKLNSNGNVQWQKCLGGTGDDFASSVQQTTDGGYIVAGQTGSNDGDVTGNQGYGDCWVVKLDSSGNILWQKCLGGTGWDVAFSIQQTTDGGYIVAGRTGSNDGDVTGNHGYWDYWVVKLDSSGIIQWQKCLGGTSDEWAGSVQQTADGGFIVTGIALSNNGDVTGHHGFYDCWVVQLDGSGNIQWQKCLGGIADDAATHVQETTDGGYIVAGGTASNDGDVTGNHGASDYWIVKLAPYVGIEENSLFSQINIYPNPVSGELRIKNAELRIEMIEIYNAMGQRVFSQPAAGSQQLIINVSSLPDGIYFVKMQSKEGIMSAKFVKD